jgi:hypothetical protein
MGGNNTRGRVRICKSHYNTYVLTMYGYNENKKGDNNSRYFVAFFPILQTTTSRFSTFLHALHRAFLLFYTLPLPLSLLRSRFIRGASATIYNLHQVLLRFSEARGIHAGPTANGAASDRSTTIPVVKSTIIRDFLAKLPCSFLFYYTDCSRSRSSAAGTPNYLTFPYGWRSTSVNRQA